MSDLSPQASPLASSGWRSPRRRLAWGLLALTLAIASSFFLFAMRELGETARREAQARAQVVADDLASQVERAVTLGIPLDKLEGVEDLFAQRVQNLAEIRSIILEDAAGRALKARASQGKLAAAPRASTKSMVKAGGRTVAAVTVEWREPGMGTLLLRWGLPLSALVAALCALGAEALRRSWSAGAEAREALCDAAAGSMRDGNFNLRLRALPRRDFDTRLPWLSAELRYVNEQYLRVQRLVESLRKTEPDAARRAALDELLHSAAGDDRFREDTSVATLQPAGWEEARARWVAIIWGAGAWTPALVAAGLWPAQDISLTMLAAVVAASPFAWLAARTSRMSGGAGTDLRGFLLGVAAIGPGWAVPIALLWRGQYDPPGYGDNALIAWGIAAGLSVALGAVPKSRARATAERAADAT